jgi:hypothetical protein
MLKTGRGETGTATARSRSTPQPNATQSRTSRGEFDDPRPSNWFRAPSSALLMWLASFGVTAHAGSAARSGGCSRTRDPCQAQFHARGHSVSGKCRRGSSMLFGASLQGSETVVRGRRLSSGLDCVSAVRWMMTVRRSPGALVAASLAGRLTPIGVLGAPKKAP